MILRASKSAAAVLFTLCLVGCAGPAKLTLRPQGQNVAFAKTFSQAYFGKESDGSFACVLVSDEVAAGLQQVVHIKVLWRPLNGLRESAVSNAAIDWYVLSNADDSPDDLLLYQGAGFVTLTLDGDEAKVHIRSADLRPAVARGKLKDPIGNATITGAFTASANNKRMRELLSDTRQRVTTVASGG
jgi:hypothetical protein